jgi:hypothetical protein
MASITSAIGVRTLRPEILTVRAVPWYSFVVGNLVDTQVTSALPPASFSSDPSSADQTFHAVKSRKAAKS